MAGVGQDSPETAQFIIIAPGFWVCQVFSRHSETWGHSLGAGLFQLHFFQGVLVLNVLLQEGVVQLGLAYFFLSKGLDVVSPVTASLTSTIEPLLNPILVAIVVGEFIGPISIFGAVLVIGAATAYNVYAARTG